MRGLRCSVGELEHGLGLHQSLDRRADQDGGDSAAELNKNARDGFGVRPSQLVASFNLSGRALSFQGKLHIGAHGGGRLGFLQAESLVLPTAEPVLGGKSWFQ